MTNEELMEIALKAYGEELRKGDRKGYRPYVKAVIAAVLPEIERLRAENAKLRATLKQIAETYNNPTTSKDGLAFIAAAALKETGDE